MSITHLSVNLKAFADYSLPRPTIISSFLTALDEPSFCLGPFGDVRLSQQANIPQGVHNAATEVAGEVPATDTALTSHEPSFWWSVPCESRLTTRGSSHHRCCICPLVPPPLGDGKPADFEEQEDGEDLFTSTVTTLESIPSSPEPISLLTEDVSTNSNGPKPAEVVLEDDTEDLFAEATEEVSLDSPEREPIISSEPSPAVTPVTPTALIAPRIESKSMSAPVIFDRSREEIEEEANGDIFDIEIGVSDPEKVGDGMNAYMAYRVTTKTSLSMFSKNEFSVKRRFSDFLGLHSKLASKYLHVGYIVPPAPEKSIVGMTKVKVGKEDLSSTEFVEKRRAALERYLQRTVKHPTLLQDPDLRQFLESSELPRAVNTQALSGAGILRMVNKAADAVNKMTIKMNESDAWFEEKQQQFENLDQQLRKLHANVEALVCHRKELSANTAAFAKSAAMLGNSEDHTALSRALSQLAEVEEKIDQLHQEQAFADFYMFSELLSDYIRLIAAVKGVFDHRMKCWQKWEDAQITLLKKRETEAKMMVANKPDKIQQAKNEIREWEAKVQQGERDFEQISKTIRKEVGRFEAKRVKDFKTVIIKYLESLVQTQQQLIKYWEAFLPEAKAIA
ncbi:Sorting nexin-2 [Myotis davidii]|uniref:Sorting nexin-2 n=1 Tax=Myotis davidii TaxID=225400 RepID=L5LTG2_MYODS|nr:Sorting nexin-2 [Myotis davidii]